MWSQSQKCGQKSCSLEYFYIIITTAVLPTFLRFCPHISESDPPWKKRPILGPKELWNGPKKNFVTPGHTLNVFFAKNRTQIGSL